MHRLCLGLLLVVASSSAWSASDAWWIGELGSENPQLARAAVAHFAGQGPRAVPLLREALQGDDVLARQYAAAALARIARPGADEALMQTLMATQDPLYMHFGGGTDPLLAQFCAEALAARGKAIIPLLRHALALDQPPDLIGVLVPDDDAAQKSRQAELARTMAFAVIYDLPPSLALPLCAEYVSRPEGNHNDAAKVFFVDQGVAGMRLWAKSFLKQTGLPDIDTVNKAWDARGDDDYEWKSFEGRWMMSTPMSPSVYEIALDSEAAMAMVRKVAEEACRSSSATERLWGFYHLAIVDRQAQPGATRPELWRRALADPCWAVPLMFLEEDPFSLEAGESQDLVPALRVLTRHPCKPLRFAAIEKLSGLADPAALDGLVLMLGGGPGEDRERAGGIIDDNSSEWTDAQKLRLLEPLLAAAVPGTPSHVFNALGKMPPSVWQTYAKRLQSPDPGTRADFAEVLGLIGALEAAPALIEALDDPDGRVRECALTALARLLHKGAAPYIQRVFDGGDATVRKTACQAAQEADDPALLARLIVASPKLVVPPTGVDVDPYEYPGIPVVTEQRDRFQERTREIVVPELVDAARCLFADEQQPERVRLVAAEAILKAGVPSRWADKSEDEGSPSVPPQETEAPKNLKGGPSPAAARAPLAPELWPALKFGLEHFPRGIRWGPNEAEPIVDATRLVRDPAAVPTLVSTLYALGTPNGTDEKCMMDDELASAITASLLWIKPEGEKAFWRLLESSSDERQIALIHMTRGGFEDPPPVAPEKLDEACLRLLHSQPREGRVLLDIVSLVQPDSAAAPEARRALREAYAQWTPGDRNRLDYLRALTRLKEPGVEAIYLQLATRRGLGNDHSWAIHQLQRLKSPDAFALALRLANSEFEAYWDRYWALRAVEVQDKPLARQIAEQWTHDWRYQMRDSGRKVLAGEHRMYL